MKNDIDAPLSEEVAKQAGMKINELKKTVEDDMNLQNSILRDYTNDARIANKFIKKVCTVLLILLFFAVSGIVGLSIYNQHLITKVTKEHNEEMFELIGNTDFETTMEIVTDNKAINHGNMTLDK